jgi:trehalose 6-phosphate phosphatase
VERIPALRSLCGVIENRLRHIAGALVENKGLTASIHYRKVGEADREDIFRIVRETVASTGHLFRITQGLEVLEIRPRVNWNKGYAARWIMESSGCPGALPIYLGDDSTDEDAFSALSFGITVRIGRAAETAAQYQLEYQEEAEEFLAWLAELDDDPAAGDRA